MKECIPSWVFVPKANVMGSNDSEAARARRAFLHARPSDSVTGKKGGFPGNSRGSPWGYGNHEEVLVGLPLQDSTGIVVRQSQFAPKVCSLTALITQHAKKRCERNSIRSGCEGPNLRICMVTRGSRGTTTRELGPKIPYYRRNYGSQFPNGCVCGPSGVQRTACTWVQWSVAVRKKVKAPSMQALATSTTCLLKTGSWPFAHAQSNHPTGWKERRKPVQQDPETTTCSRQGRLPLLCANAGTPDQFYFKSLLSRTPTDSSTSHPNQPDSLAVVSQGCKACVGIQRMRMRSRIKKDLGQLRFWLGIGTG